MLKKDDCPELKSIIQPEALYKVQIYMTIICNARLDVITLHVYSAVPSIMLLFLFRSTLQVGRNQSAVNYIPISTGAKLGVTCPLTFPLDNIPLITFTAIGL